MQHPTIQAALSFLLLMGILSAALGQTVVPFATHDCSNQAAYVGDIACNNKLTTCCAATGQCCAGGCCPYNAYCVFVGTAKEACCPLSDTNQCGAAPPPSSKTCPSASAPSVPCSGVGSSWYCAPGCTCNVSVRSGCNCLTSCSGGSGGGGGGASSAAAAAGSSSRVASGSAAAAPASSLQAQSSAAVVTSKSGSSTTAAAAATTTGANNAGSLIADNGWGLAAIAVLVVLIGL